MAFTYKRLNAPGSGSGGSVTPSITSFVNGDWTGPASGEYSITVTEATHGKGSNPTVTVYEDNTGTFERVEPSIELNASGDVTISVTETPDLRFEGKIIIL